MLKNQFPTASAYKYVMCQLTLSPKSKLGLGLAAVQLRQFFRLFFLLNPENVIIGTPSFTALFYCTTDNMCVCVFLTFTEGLQQPCESTGTIFQ